MKRKIYFFSILFIFFMMLQNAGFASINIDVEAIGGKQNLFSDIDLKSILDDHELEYLKELKNKTLHVPIGLELMDGGKAGLSLYIFENLGTLMALDLDYIRVVDIEDRREQFSQGSLDIMPVVTDQNDRYYTMPLLAFQGNQSTQYYRLQISEHYSGLVGIIDKLIMAGVGDVINKQYYSSYIVNNHNEFQLTTSEREFVESLGVIRVLIDDDFNPLSFYDSDKKTYIGASVEMFEKICSLIGVKYNYVYDENLKWIDKLNLIESGESDIIFPVSVTEKRQEIGYFTDSYYSAYYSLISTTNSKIYISSIYELLHEQVGVVRGTSINEYLEKKLIQSNIVHFDSDEDMYSALKNNSLKFIVQNEGVFQEDYFEKELLDFVSIYRIEESPKNYCYFTNQSDEMLKLIPLINRAMKYYDVEKIFTKYKVAEEVLIKKYIDQKTIQMISIAVIILLLCLFMFLYVTNKKSQKILEKEVTLNKMAYLQSQIKPHFLYNALSTIVSFCYTDGEKAGDLLNNFSSYLRIVFNADNKNEYVTLNHEMELVEAYLSIEKARYGQRLEVMIHIDEDCWQHKILPLIIQPLIENSINHGIMKKEDGGIITLHVKMEIECICITVADDGVGMTEDQLIQILSSKNAVGVGLVNIRERMSRYGKDKFEIRSKRREGTRVVLRVPIIGGGGKCIEQ